MLCTQTQAESRFSCYHLNFLDIYIYTHYMYMLRCICLYLDGRTLESNMYLLRSWRRSCSCHLLQAEGVVACWVAVVALEPVWRGVAASGRKKAGWSWIRHDSEYWEGWESSGERAPSPPGAEEAAGAGGSGLGLGHLCLGCVGEWWVDDEGRRATECCWAGRRRGWPALVGLGPASWCLRRKTVLLHAIWNNNTTKLVKASSLTSADHVWTRSSGSTLWGSWCELG